MKTNLYRWIFFIIGLIILSSSGVINQPKGKFKLYWWDGRHGHTHILKLTSGKFTHTSWSNNFFAPTKITIKGDVSMESDSLVLHPKSIQFYRGQEQDKHREYKKVKCACNDKELAKIQENEYFVISLCATEKLYSDSLASKGLKMKYVRQ